jgi:ABC-type antimicrobial peptide transport system permease subunit
MMPLSSTARHTADALASDLRYFAASGVRVSVIAMALGLPLSVAALKVGVSQGAIVAPEVNPYLLGLAIAPLLVAVACVATWLPARRVALVDPARTLREE